MESGQGEVYKRKLNYMLEERERIVAVDNEVVWVETIQLSTCGSCAAKKGCGQSLLASLGAKPNVLRVLLPTGKSGDYRLDQPIIIGLPENIVIKTSLLLYMLPLCSMLAGSAAAHNYFGNELFTIAMALAGLFLGAVVINLYSHKYRGDPRFQPVIIDREEVSILNGDALKI